MLAVTLACNRRRLFKMRKDIPSMNHSGAAACTLAILLGSIWVPAHAQLPAPGYDARLIREVDNYRRAHERMIVGELDELTRLRSVAADPAGLVATARHLEDLLRARGFKTAQLRDAPATPALVFGALSRQGAQRTVVFYAHYDGQPVTPSQWDSDPFVPVMRSAALDASARIINWQAAREPFDPQWRLFGRAVADDKASIVAFLSALDALTAAGRQPAVNIKAVWDGEEEAGSPHIETILRANRARLAGDLWLIGDGPVHQTREPTLYFGARGVVGLEMTVYGPVRALHDGHYGNWVPNPAAMAAQLISEMRDDEGRILIPGFGDDVRPIPAQALAAVGQLPPVEDSLKREFGIGRSEGGEGLIASTLRPALNVRGVRSGQVGSEAANAIPVDAVVSLDFRLVPDQTPAGVQEKVQTFLRAQGWTVVASTPNITQRRSQPRLVKLVWQPGYPALRTDMSLPAARAVIAAMRRATQQPVALLPSIGGSVPIYLFADIFKVPVIGLPIVNHDDNQHAANENLRLQNLWDGIDAYAAMLSDLQW
jgi:acetylornithine deacetylase/succinyl-diaminopimelate desuccinylase-like protein